MRGRKKKNYNEEYNGEKDTEKVQKFPTEKSFDDALQEAPTEEHFVLRLPEKQANQLRSLVKTRVVPTSDQLSFTWKDHRNGKMMVMGQPLSVMLVDLPCIVESLKTLDNKQFYKVADVSQMVIAHERKKPPIQGRDFAWKDGLSFVLQDVRNSRFRKRMNKKIVEDVEQEVERLLLADYEADDVTFEVLERKENEESEEEEDSEDESVIAGGQNEDFDMDAAIDEAMDKPDESDQDEESDDDTDESDQEEEEEDPDEKNEENELKIQANVLKHEISAMEIKLAEKDKQASNQERFKGIVEKLARELQLKREQLEKLHEEIEENA